MATGVIGRDEDLATLAAARGWASAGHGVAIATVITTWGSAPRREGSHLAVRADGLFAGSVSGGCVEADVILAAQDMIAAAAGHAVLDYGVADTVAWSAGLACGGRISILVQRMADDALPPELVDQVLAATAAGQLAAISSDPASGRAEAGEAGPFVRRYPPPRRLFIIGAVHIAQALVPLAHGLGVAQTVIDPRGLFAADERFGGLELDRRWPDEALAGMLNQASAVVALTHDPKIDDVALACALRSSAHYVAALGSRKNHAGRLERLAAQGFGPDDLARIHGPAGLAIGASGPAEIALSIAAQMTAAWRNEAGRSALAA
ncbi:XdhC family protein [Sandarakinorhabdus sp.]|uniref:XdhC family protein n=1 Tax=Sandarakinorhabdus sp. TaxID=1916663 RepID=UPI0035621568